MLCRSDFYASWSSDQAVLIVGAGGGFDVFCGLPMYYELRDRRVQVHLASLTLAEITLAEGIERISQGCYRVDADTEGLDYYFPEKVLSQWFRSCGEEVSVYCIAMSGVCTMTEDYIALCDLLGITDVILVDAGMDSLMKGDEGSWHCGYEDIANLVAVSKLSSIRATLAGIGFGIDALEGLSYYYVLDAIADLTRKGAFYGANAWCKEMTEVKRYMEAVKFSEHAMPWSASTAQSAICAALEGSFGDLKIVHAPGKPVVWINPLMTLCWLFDLHMVAEQLPFLRDLEKTMTSGDVFCVIENYRSIAPKRERRSMPF